MDTSQPGDSPLLLLSKECEKIRIARCCKDFVDSDYKRIHPNLSISIKDVCGKKWMNNIHLYINKKNENLVIYDPHKDKYEGLPTDTDDNRYTIIYDEKKR